MNPIPITTASITKKEIEYVKQAVTQGWGENANLFHIKFNEVFSKYIGVKYALPTSSCTGALHLALAALGIKKGDTVIIPDITWTATVAPVTYTGATPIFVDIERDSWCMCPKSLEKNILPSTKAIITVDLYGNMANYKAIKKIASHYSIPIIEDAAEAIGSEYRGQKAGALGDIGVFSFHGSKTMTTGEGGMLVTNNKEYFDRIVFLSDHGRSITDRSFWFEEIGYKYKMSAMQAALGIAQLERIDELIEKKQQNFAWYKKYLQHIPGITLNSTGKNAKHSFWMVTAVFDKEFNLNKENIAEKLQKYGIMTRPFFYPLSMMPAYAPFVKNKKINNPVAYDLHWHSINLPSGWSLTEKEVLFICKKIKDIIAENSMEQNQNYPLMKQHQI